VRRGIGHITVEKVAVIEKRIQRISHNDQDRDRYKEKGQNDQGRYERREYFTSFTTSKSGEGEFS
jgi:hypothetical protein